MDLDPLLSYIGDAVIGLSCLNINSLFFPLDLNNDCLFHNAFSLGSLEIFLRRSLRGGAEVDEWGALVSTVWDFIFTLIVKIVWDEL